MPKPGPRPVRVPVWFVDTSTLMTLAAHPPLQIAVSTYLDSANVALCDVVFDELTELAKYGSPHEARLARGALGQLGWLGSQVDTSHLRGEDVEAVRTVVANGRVLQRQHQHWAESAIICLAGTLPQRIPHLLSEDYDARVAALQSHLIPFSTHKLLSRMVKEGNLAATDAEDFATALMGRRGVPTAPPRSSAAVASDG